MNRANLEQIFGRYVKRFPELNTGDMTRYINGKSQRSSAR